MQATATRRRVSQIQAMREPVNGYELGFGNSGFGAGPFGVSFPMPLSMVIAERELIPGPVAVREQVTGRMHGFSNSPFGTGPFGSGWTIDVRPARAERMEI